MSERRVRNRIEEASAGYAKGGSARSASSIKNRILSVLKIVLSASALSAVIFGIIVLGFKIKLLDSSKKKSSNVTVCYGELEVKTKREYAYNQNGICISLSKLKDMLHITVTRDKNEITLYTYSGDSISLMLESNQVRVNKIAFSLSSPVRECDGEIFISADIVNRFISSTSVIEDEKENRITVISLEGDPSKLYFTPKKSEEMGQMAQPATVQGGTSYSPDGTTPGGITTSIPDPKKIP